ncbi:tripartite motif-containing protein 2 [Magallana gigas]|uniref:tripartite motif-containing protein 2 n=1 Tax=Magallana gigas TaxID=29159 RepID=UPI003340A379
MSEEEIPDTAQHYLVCGTEECKNNCQFYCNHCHRQLCEECTDEHKKGPENNNHEVVPYRQRKPQLPEEKCKLHQKRNVDIFCKDCNVPLCSKCIFMKEHSSHQFDDLEEKYAEKFAFCQNEISKIKNHFLSTTLDFKQEIKEDVTKLEDAMEDIRNSIKAEAESLKKLIEKVTSDKLAQVNTVENSLKRSLESQETVFDDYIAYLDKLVKEFHSYMSSSDFNVLFSDDFENLKIQSIPETTQQVLPMFTAGQFCRDEVTKLLGCVNIPSHEPEKRKIKPMETSSSRLKHTGENMKPTLSLSSSVTKIREYTVPGVDRVYHISFGKSGRLWISDRHGKLVQTDLHGIQLQKIQTSGHGGYVYGIHTVTQDRDLMYTDERNKVIYRIKQDNTTTEFIKTGDWTPISIHSSHINGDILVGMMAKVTRYNRTGEEIQNIQRDKDGQSLYDCPNYITENINGDICTSDINKYAVVVVNKLGQHRFSYTGQGSGFLPKGICTDLLGYILVCDTHINNDTVHLLDQDGQFILFLLSKQVNSTSVCVDNENNLHVGRHDTNTVKVYKYLQ